MIKAFRIAYTISLLIVTFVWMASACLLDSDYWTTAMKVLVVASAYLMIAAYRAGYTH